MNRDGTRTIDRIARDAVVSRWSAITRLSVLDIEALGHFALLALETFEKIATGCRWAEAQGIALEPRSLRESLEALGHVPTAVTEATSVTEERTDA